MKEHLRDAMDSVRKRLDDDTEAPPRCSLDLRCEILLGHAGFQPSK